MVIIAEILQHQEKGRLEQLVKKRRFLNRLQRPQLYQVVESNLLILGHQRTLKHRRSKQTSMQKVKMTRMNQVKRNTRKEVLRSILLQLRLKIISRSYGVKKTNYSG